MPFDDSALFGGSLPNDLVYRPPADDAATRDLIFRPGGMDPQSAAPAASIPAPVPSMASAAPFVGGAPPSPSGGGTGWGSAPPPNAVPPPQQTSGPGSLSGAGFASFLQRLLGAEPNNPDQNLVTRGSLGAGLSSVAQNWNKPGMAAFAGGAGAAIQGGEKTMLALINEAIKARQVGDMAAYRRAYLGIIDQAKNRTPFELQRARAFTRNLGGQSTPGDPAGASPALGSEGNPHSPQTMDDFAKVPLGNYFRNPADGRVLQKMSEPPAAAAPAAPAAPLDPALNPGNE